MREMIDSGIEWVGKIPRDWDNKIMRHLLISRDGGAWGSEPEEDSKGTICLRIADFNFAKGCFKTRDHDELNKRE